MAFHGLCVGVFEVFLSDTTDSTFQTNPKTTGVKSYDHLGKKHSV